MMTMLREHPQCNEIRMEEILPLGILPCIEAVRMWTNDSKRPALIRAMNKETKFTWSMENKTYLLLSSAACIYQSQTPIDFLNPMFTLSSTTRMSESE